MNTVKRTWQMEQKVPTGKVIPWKEGNEIKAQSQMKEQSEKVPKVSTGNVKPWKEGNKMNAITDERTYLQW